MTAVSLLLLSALLQSLSDAVCFSLIFKNGRFHRRSSFIILFVFMASTNCISILFPFTSLKTIVMFSSRFLLICMLYKEPIKEKLFLFSLVYAINAPLEALTFAIFEPKFISLISVTSENIIGRALTGLIPPAFQIPWVLMFRKLRKEWNDSILNKFYIFVLGQFFLESAALLAVYINLLPGKRDTVVDIPQNTICQYKIGIVLFILVTLVIYFVLFSYLKREQMNIQLRLKNEELEKDMLFYRKSVQKAAQIRKFRHDAENHLRMAEYLIEEDPAKAQIYLDELKKSIHEL